MTEDRWTALMVDDTLPLTDQEADLGWHFCLEWDGLLVGPGMGELRACCCPAPAIEAARQAMPPPEPEQPGPPPF